MVFYHILFNLLFINIYNMAGNINSEIFAALKNMQNNFLNQPVL